MSDRTRIEWASATWSPVTGCSKVSPGCAHCFAERMARRLAGRFGYPADEPFRVTLHPDKLDEPLRWKKPRRIFVNSMSDLFHPEVPFDFINEVVYMMFRASWHTYLVLTKRPERAIDYVYWRAQLSHAPLLSDQVLPPNLWFGVSAENQQAADERVPLLLQTPAAVKFISAEPLLTPLNILDYLGKYVKWDSTGRIVEQRPGLNWVIAGAESGPSRRPADIDWFRHLCDQCSISNVPFFLKQMEIGGRLVKMPELDGKVWAQMPKVHHDA